MTMIIEPASDVDSAWLNAVRATSALPGGHAVHLLMTVTSPLPARRALEPLIDTLLAAHDEYRVGTVASTIFPLEIYHAPSFGFQHDLEDAERQALDSAANTLYRDYTRALPTLLTANGNSGGTYFQRMISYAKPKGGGFNQLEARISSIRSMTKPTSRSHGRGTGNFFNIDLAGDGDPDSLHTAGLQVLDPKGRKERGFPCLVHVDITVVNRQMHLLAVYRRQNLITKAYGNLVGLARLQGFLAQQTGLALGHLTVLAAYADVEHGAYTKRAVQQLITDAGRRLDTS